MAATIKVPFPHMALNSHNVPPPDYLMFNTWKVAASTTVSHMIGWTAKVARGGPGLSSPPSSSTRMAGPGTSTLGSVSA
jgi:hypothetical protein